MKIEWKKSEKAIYLPKTEPELRVIPAQSFFTIKGKGNPNSSDFSDRVSVLYSLAYAVRMMPKNGFEPLGYFEYTVYPLEGIWNLSKEEKKHDPMATGTINKDELSYKIMIRQPEFVTKEVVDKAFEIVSRKKPSPLLDEVSFETMEDGLSVQMMHLGSYDDEPSSFQKMRSFMVEQRLEFRDKAHREIYVTAAKSPSSEEDRKKQKTVLRYLVKRK